MTDTTSIFENTSNQTQQTEATSNASNTPSNDLTTLLSAIKNERGEVKYRSVEDALKGLAHSQEFIPKLTSQLAEKEAKLKEAEALQARMEELQRTVETLSRQSSVNEPTAQPALSEDVIADVVNKALTRRQTEEVQKANISSVVASLQATYGNAAEQTYNERAAELGMTVADLNRLAATNPKAVFKLLGVNEGVKKPSGQYQQGSYNTEAFQPKVETLVGRNTKPALVGATSQDLQEESANARKMAEELHAKGMSVHDLSDPKVYFKHFR
jgi:hypothetical protein